MEHPRDRAHSTNSSTANGHRRTASTKNATTRSTASTVLTLFTTNLRLLNLDLLPDWPNITTASFGNQDARQRIRSTEFALYHLFRLYDSATTAEKLQPFYPPLEPLQSINLRAALYRCLNDLKKNGILGKETVLRKTMLDECSGDKFWELCLVLSAIVLRKVTLEKKRTYASRKHGPAIAERLGTAQTLGKGQKESLLPLTVAHRVSLGKALEEKRRKREVFGRVYDVLMEKEADLDRRREVAQEMAEKRPVDKKRAQWLESVEERATRGWVGSKQLRDVLLHGDEAAGGDGMLSKPLEDVAETSETDGRDVGLLRSMEQTARKQSQRVRRWQSMHEKLLASRSTSTEVNGTDGTAAAAQLRFEKHRTLSLRDAHLGRPGHPPRQRSDTHASAAAAKYDEILTAMREELRRNRRATAPTPSPTKPTVAARKGPPSRNPSIHLDTSAGASEPLQRSPSFPSSQTAVPMRPSIGRRISSRSRSYQQPKVESQRQFIPLKSEIFSPLKRDQRRRSSGSPLSSSSLLATPVEESMPEAAVLNANVARDENRRSSEIKANGTGTGSGDSGIGLGIEPVVSHDKSEVSEGTLTPPFTAEPDVIKIPDRDFKVPALPAPESKSSARPSLAERTRMSMAFRSSEDVNGTTQSPLPTTAEDPTPRSETNTPLDHTVSLLDRTRQSISLAPTQHQPTSAPAKKKSAGHSRARSSIYPINQFDTPKKAPRRSSVALDETSGNPIAAASRRDITPREQLFSPEAEYDSVFKARPKIALSPVLSPFAEAKINPMDTHGLTAGGLDEMGRSSPLVGIGGRQ